MECLSLSVHFVDGESALSIAVCTMQQPSIVSEGTEIEGCFFKHEIA
jgi:hypothetical protein